MLPENRHLDFFFFASRLGPLGWVFFRPLGPWALWAQGPWARDPGPGPGAGTRGRDPGPDFAACRPHPDPDLDPHLHN